MIQEIKITNLTLLEKNPRRISEKQFQKLCKSLQDDPNFLNKRPVLVNKVNDVLQVYAGNQRVKAAKKLKWKTIPCDVDEDLDENVMRSRIIKDNKQFGEFDWDILANEWEMADLIDYGFTADELVGAVQDIDTKETEEEDSEILEPAKDEDANTETGDFYDLESNSINGSLNHRIICGDSTNPDIVSLCLNQEAPILMVTDPPYGVNYDPNWRGEAGKGQKASGKVQNDDKVNWSLAWHLFPGSIAYVWHAGKHCSAVQKSLEEAEFEIINQIIWIKQHFALSRGDYHWQHEPCWYAVKKGHQHNWQGARDQSTIWEISNLNAFGKSKEEGEERTSHSTQKPVECMVRPIRNNTAPGEGVYDPFIGSGTTLIAAEQLGRHCYGIEISPAYVDIAVNRWVKYIKKYNKEFKIRRNGEVIEWQLQE